MCVNICETVCVKRWWITLLPDWNRQYPQTSHTVTSSYWNPWRKTTPGTPSFHTPVVSVLNCRGGTQELEHLIGELEHLTNVETWKTRLIDEMFVSVMGWVCDLDVMGAPSKLSVIHKNTDFVRVRPTLLLRCEEKSTRWKWNCPRSVSSSWTPETGKIRSVSRWSCKNKVSRINYVTSQTSITRIFVYYKSIKREVNRRLMCVGVMKD